MIDKATTLAEVVKAPPATLEVLQYHDITPDSRSIGEAAEQAGLCGCELALTLDLLARGQAGPWSMPISDLLDHIVATHHAWLKANFPRGTKLLADARRAAGDPRAIDELIGVHESLRAEIEMHLMKEEQILFPMIRQLDRGEPIEFGCGHVEGPISQMRHEHDGAKGELRRIKAMRLAGLAGRAGLDDAAARQVEAYLQELHDDLVLHIYKENHVLFPRATALTEAEVSAE
ncbi:MAG: hemerythrin domain-containing protein [Phycisphaerae bacterium]|nr:hemerythrin domain-containing protein [Phycisphaerae bacterium]